MRMSCYTTTAESRGMSGNCSSAKAKVADAPTLSLGICIEAPRCYAKCMEPPFHSGVVGRAPATRGKGVPINPSGLS